MRIGGVKSIWRDSQLMLLAVVVILHRVVELGGLLICDALGILILALPVPVFVKHIVQRLDFLSYLTNQMQILFGVIPSYLNLSVEEILNLDPNQSLPFDEGNDKF